MPYDRPWRAVCTVSKGHGRLETRHLTCTDDLDDYLNWPGVQQVLQRECERVRLKTAGVGAAQDGAGMALVCQPGGLAG
jgi:hypothetical protein